MPSLRETPEERKQRQIRERQAASEARVERVWRGEPAIEAPSALNDVGDNIQNTSQEDRGERQRKQADILLEIAGQAVLFHNHEGVAFADITIKGHRETWPVRSRGFRNWLAFQYWSQEQSAPNADAMKNACTVIEALATFEGDEHAVAVRIGGHDGRIYVDLCNDDWSAVEIDGDGWRLIDEPPIRFVRATGMLPLPLPAQSRMTVKERIGYLREFINVADKADFALVVAWLLAALREHGPYPVLAFIAQHGSAKAQR
jgi:hypothetical protein